jgi:O-antigen ligase
MGACLARAQEQVQGFWAGGLKVVAHLAIPKRSLWATLVKGIGEWFFALFLFAGYYKADPRLAFIQTHLDLTLLFMILSFLVFFHRLLRKPFAQKIPAGFIKVAALFLLLASCFLGGLLISQSTGYGLDKTLRFIVLTGWAFFGTAFLITDFQSLRRFSWAVVIIATVMAIDALLNYPGVGKVAFVSALGSNYIALARAGGFGLLTTLAFLLLTEQRSLVRLSLWILAVLQFWAALIAGARGPVLALILTFLVFFMLSVRGFAELKIDQFAWKLGIVAIIVAIIAGIVGQELFPTLAFRTQVFITDLGDSAKMRLNLYEEAIKLWTSSPIWGVGTGGFAIAVTGSAFIREYPHNIVLELGAEIGLVGVLVFIAMMYMAFRIGLAIVRNSSGLMRVTIRYLLVSVYFALLNAMVSGDINDNRILFTWLSLNVAATRFRYNGRENPFDDASPKLRIGT